MPLMCLSVIIIKRCIMTISRDTLDLVDFSDITTGELMEPVFPGEHLDEIMSDYNLSTHQLAGDIMVSPGIISGILEGRQEITADTAVRLGRYFNTSAQFWMNLQSGYDLSRVEVFDEIIPLAMV